MRTLRTKLSLVLLGVLSVVAAVTAGLTLRTSRLYQQEIQQELNAELAAKVISSEELIEDGRLRARAAEEIFELLMLMNPDLEVYLLDAEGTIVSFSAPPDRVRRTKVSLGPVRAFIDGSATLPVFGDDPRDPAGRKIFSAAPVRTEDGRLLGYLYLVLASEQAETVAQMLETSYILRTSTWIAGGTILLTLVGGLFLFGRITRRLRALSQRISRFQAETLGDAPGAPEQSRPADELDELAEGFDRMARRIREQLEQLEADDRKRRELVANISHDVRTPLTQLQGYIETLLVKGDELSASERREYLEIAAQQSRRLGRLFSDLFELAKLDGLATPPRLEPFPIAELVQDVAQEFRLQASDHGIELDVEIEGHPGRIVADVGVIERALENLVANALQHSRRGDRVRVAVREGDETVCVEVADTGPGIPRQEQERIFERFYRGSSGHRDEDAGSGLGLAIAHRALELHASELHCESESGSGATFWFELSRSPEPRSALSSA